MAILRNKKQDTFKFIKAVSVTLLDIINVTYYDKPFIFIRAIRSI